MASTTVPSAVNARRKCMLRPRMDDPTPYFTPKQKRVCGKYVIAPGYNELVDIIDADTIGKRVRVKNTTGGTWGAGTLLFPDTLKLTPQTSAVASNNPLAGSSIVLNVTGAWEVGMIVEITDGTNPVYALITAVNGGLGTITVDFLPYSYTTPTVTALPAYEATVADMNGAKPAEWVVKTAIVAGAYGDAFDCAEVTGVDTSALTLESLQYLGAAGAYQAAAPSGADQCVQVVGVVKKVAVSGLMLFFPGNKRILKMGTSFIQPGNGGGIFLFPEIDLKTVADYTLAIPSGFINPDEFGIRLTTLGGTVVTQPTIRFGIPGTLAKYVPAQLTTLLTALGKRERFEGLPVDDEETQVTFGVTVIAAGSGAIKGTPYVKGLNF